MSGDRHESIEEIEGVGRKRADALREAGYESVSALRSATTDELATVESISRSLAGRIKEGIGGANAPSGGGRLRVTPDEWTVTKRQAAHLEALSGTDARELLGESVADVRDRLEWEIDPELLNFRVVCGRVVKRDPVTGELHPVPYATVHVEDTDCDLLWYFPDGWLWGWLYPYGCRREEIATVKTDACGRFCVVVPRWEIDRLLRFRRERICLPELFKPDIRDVLDDLRILPEPIVRPPRPRPDPAPFPYEEPGAFARIREVLDEEVATRLKSLTADATLGDSTREAIELLDAPAFPRSMPPPLPEPIHGRNEKTASFLDERIALDVDRIPEVDPGDFIGPFRRCFDVFVPEWTTITDVPDVTFRVTQDVDGDGNEETIYSEGFFDVRWDASPIPDVTLEASGNALETTACDLEEPDPDDCDEPLIYAVGRMPLSGDYHDASTGYALRPNRPRPGGLPDDPQSDPASTPYRGTLQLTGCVRFGDAEYYRFQYTYRERPGDPEPSPVPFTGVSWWAGRARRGLPSKRMAPVDGEGWYRIDDLDDLDFPNWLFNWPTPGPRGNGLYNVRLQIADGDKNVMDDSDWVAFRVDSSRPEALIHQVRWRAPSVGAGETLPAHCPIIDRPVDGAGDPVPIEVDVTYSVTASHLRNLSVGMSGCDGDPSRKIRETPPDAKRADRADFVHWHEDAGDNSYSRTATFEVPGGLDEGAYEVGLTANGRAFNPAGRGGGPGGDWYINPVDSHQYTERRIAIIDADAGGP